MLLPLMYSATVLSNLDHPDLEFPDIWIIRTFVSGPFIFTFVKGFLIIIFRLSGILIIQSFCLVRKSPDNRSSTVLESLGVLRVTFSMLNDASSNIPSNSLPNDHSCRFIKGYVCFLHPLSAY